MSMTTAVVLGTGAWGTTFAQVLADAGVDVTMWGRNTDAISFINGRENPTYLPGITLSERITATTDIAEAVARKPLVVVAVPVKAVRATLEAARQSFVPNMNSITPANTTIFAPDVPAPVPTGALFSRHQRSAGSR